jgi:HAD superfamily hydrolase (TIGR01509 family)
MIRTVISDLGNVILWFDNSIFFKKLSAHCSSSEEEVREAAHTNLGLIRLFDTGQIAPQEFYSRIVKELKAQIDQEHFFDIYCDVFSLNMAVLKILQKLKGSCKLVLLSNTDVCRFGFIRKRFPEILIFDEYVLSFELGVMKPDPAIYVEALKKAGAEPQECVFIDDLERNIEGSQKMGMRGILYTPGTDLEADLRKLGLTF